MDAYVVRRGLRTVIVLVVASIAVFYGLRVAPGDPTAGVLSPTVVRKYVRPTASGSGSTSRSGCNTASI